MRPQDRGPSARPETRWRPYRPYSYPAALDGMGTIAAPLLASLSIALIAVVLSSAQAFRLLSGVLLLLLIAAGGFIATLECSFIARQYVVTPSQLEEWWPDNADQRRRDALRREQRFYRDRFKFWSNRARWAYDIGIVTLALGVAALLVPPGHIDLARAAAITFAATATAAEIAWIVSTRVRQLSAELPAVGPESGPGPASSASSGSS